MSKISVINIDDAEVEALAKAFERCCWWIQQALEIEITAAKRVPATAEPYKHPGWLEYCIRIVFRTGNVMYVAMIQRQPGAAYEFHS
jgi:hypothetical protein